MLLQIAVPTRTDVPEYQKLRATAHRIVGRINGRFGSVGYAPIHYPNASPNPTPKPKPKPQP